MLSIYFHLARADRVIQLCLARSPREGSVWIHKSGSVVHVNRGIYDCLKEESSTENQPFSDYRNWVWGRSTHPVKVFDYRKQTRGFKCQNKPNILLNFYRYILDKSLKQELHILASIKMTLVWFQE